MLVVVDSSLAISNLVGSTSRHTFAYARLCAAALFEHLFDSVFVLYVFKLDYRVAVIAGRSTDNQDRKYLLDQALHLIRVRIQNQYVCSLPVSYLENG